jgi:hypothetical protein
MFRASLREMFLLVAAIALAILSLLGASIFWQGAVGLIVMLASGAAIITGIMERGSRQAFAIGFGVAMFGYALIVWNGERYADGPRKNKNMELVGLDGQLPTSLLLHYLHLKIDRSGYIDANTGKDISEAELAKTPLDYSTGTGLVAGRPVQYVQRPRQEVFSPIGHYWWGLLFGYIGGRFAENLYTRRKNLQR